MSKKIIISDKRKAFIKAKFNKIKPETLKQEERKYYNKVKAGKTRSSKALKDSSGKFIAFSDEFIRQNIFPILKLKGKTQTKENALEYLRDPEIKKEAKRNQDTKELPVLYTPEEFKNSSYKNTKSIVYFIEDGNGLTRVGTQEEAYLKMLSYKQRVLSIGAVSYNTTVTYKKGFTQCVIYLPEINEDTTLEELEAFNSEGDIFFIVSNKNTAKK